MTPPPPAKRKLILELLEDRVKGIRRANGFDTDAGDVVFHGSVTLGPDDPKLAIAFAVGATETNPDQPGKKIITIPLEFHALVYYEVADAWRMAEAVLADIKRAVEQADLTLGGLAVDFAAGEVVPIDRAEGTTTVGRIAQYRVLYTEHWGNPDK